MDLFFFHIKIDFDKIQRPAEGDKSDCARAF